MRINNLINFYIKHGSEKLRYFILILLYSDKYLSYDNNNNNMLDIKRFFEIVNKLPIELQMLLIHRLTGSNGWIISLTHINMYIEELL